MSHRSMTMRIVVGLAFAIGILLVKQFEASAQTIAPVPSATPTVFQADADYGRLIVDTDLLTSPNGTVLDDYERGHEFIVHSQYAGDGWYQVEMLNDGEIGWVPIDTVQIALIGSTGTFREYADGYCSYTPIVARTRPGTDFFTSFRNELVFGDELKVGELDTYYLIFNNEIKDIEVRTSEITNSIALPNWWTRTHSQFDPKWTNEPSWRLEAECPPKLTTDDNG